MIFLIQNFIYLSISQHVNNLYGFFFFRYHTRNRLLLQGFVNVNPENDKFQKKSYLERVQIGFFALFFCIDSATFQRH